MKDQGRRPARGWGGLHLSSFIFHPCFTARSSHRQFLERFEVLTCKKSRSVTGTKTKSVTRTGTESTMRSSRRFRTFRREASSLPNASGTIRERIPAFREAMSTLDGRMPNPVGMKRSGAARLRPARMTSVRWAGRWVSVMPMMKSSSSEKRNEAGTSTDGSSIRHHPKTT